MKKLKEITNPRHVYDGCFETYFIRPFVHHYADFKGGESGKSCALSLLSWLIVTLGIVGILMGQVGLMGPEAGFSAMLIISCIWGAASITPLAALLIRASHGTDGHTTKPRLLGVDTLLLISCILFFLLGFLMMLTTLNSGSLNPNAGYNPDEDSVKLEIEEVTEEPIFTYDNQLTAPVEVEDTMSGFDDPDAVSPDESFDPTLNPVDAETETPASPTEVKDTTMF